MGASVLIVDDDELIQEMITIVMSRSGHATTVAVTIQKAMAALLHQSFDLVITDLRLPDGSGLQILAEIQLNHQNTNVILITGFPDVETIRAALRQGAFDYLIKPVMPSELVHVVGRAIEHRRLREEREMLNNRLAAVFRGVDDAIVALDQKWHIIQFNNAATELLGLSPAAMDQPLKNETPWLFSSVAPLLLAAREQGTDRRAVSMVTLHDDGVEKILSCTASPFHDPVHDTQGAILVVRDESRLAMLERETKTRQGWHGMVGASRPMQEVYELIARLADVDSTVLISGETGSGKELVARALHSTSPRRQRAFVAVNCAALPAGLLESELFGHVRGAFTGAIRDKQGRFKMADGGTIFLDEIGDLTLEMQVRLLRVLQEQVFEAVGDNHPIHVDVRVVTATHHNLRERVQEGLFREDLYYRLKVVEVQLPPLRARKADLPLLIDHFLTKFNTRLKRSIKGVSKEVLVALMEHNWPGNVRELEHLLEHAMVVAQQPILSWSDLPPEFRARALTPHPPDQQRPAASHRGRPLKSGQPAGEGPDRATILRALTDSRWQVQATARKLGISRSTLWRRMKSMGLHHPDENNSTEGKQEEQK